MNTNSKLEEFNLEEKYGLETILPRDEFLSKMNFLKSGLTTDYAKNSLHKNGPNELKSAKEKKWYNYFFDSLFTPFNIILLGIMLVLFYTDVILQEQANYSNIIVILVLVSASTLLEFSQEYRSNKAAAKLKSLVATTTTVIRDNVRTKIPVRDVTLGDVIILSAGDLIPADLRIIEAKDLYVSQSSLTGESDAVKKIVNSELKSIKDIENITDLDNICFMGTNVISGSAKGIVIKTAKDTYFGRIAKNITTGKPKTAFQKGLENVSKLLVRFMLVMIPITFLINVWKHDVLTAFTFSVAIAIGITPLLLPVILSSTLAKGAIRMSKKKTIVKKLDSIQSFGAMNILCTDKTGTLTEDKIVLEKYLDVKGNEDYGVLKHAFLNAYFQTGLKGNIDEAIIKRALENDMGNMLENYKKIDEIPFDFSRRRLSVVVSKGEKTQLITKGAVEEILSICTMINFNGEVSKITNEIKDNIRSITKNMNKDGLRVIAVCQKNDVAGITDFGIKDESKMVLMGFIGFLDPPKESAKEAIDRLNNKGVRVIVLTGDNAEVTKCICEKVNINSRKNCFR
ncbi:MAG: HAD-IC family P-type ATPase [Clostridia bacterium]|nr:HAD-IC family P-type ATPase [Clostridia bacterium]